MKTPLAIAIGFVLTATVADVGHAQVQRSGSDAATRLMQQMQQLSTEKSALKSENDQLKKQVEQLQGELKQAKAARDEVQAKARNLQASAQRSASDAQTQEQLEKTRGQMQELIGKFRETAQSLRDVETDRALVKTQLAQREREYKTCVDRNVDFYNLNGEILGKLEDRGFLSSFTSVEPFTRIARTRLDNLIEDYRYRADELKVERAEKTALAPSP